MRDYQLNLESGDALIVVPPLASTTMPSLPAHLLQACARESGFRVSVLYGNLIFAAEIGQLNYEAVSRGSLQYMLGERLFCSAAYGLPPFGSDDFLSRLKGAQLKVNNNNLCVELKAADLLQWERSARDFIDRLSRAIAKRGFRVVGCTSTFEQTGASLALLNQIKRLAPSAVTILGGANCEGEMAEGILTLSTNVDYIFSGESERTFPDFLGRISEHEHPVVQIIRGEPCFRLDDIPSADFTEFFEQRNRWLTGAELDEKQNLWLTYETSRGCWWGQKKHCTFCGLNGETMRFRQKSVERLFSDVKTMLSRFPTSRVCMTDNIMPHDYFSDFLPRAPEEIPGVTCFYEVKANLSLRDVVALKQAGVKQLQPGIESLSSACLKLMKKGVSAHQNIKLLRYARAVGVWMGWNILYALPGDKLDDYRTTLELIPLLRHLQPPLGLSHLSLERFSPYFVNPTLYGIENIRTLDAYHAFLPQRADVSKVAYHFKGDYRSESKSNRQLMKRLETEIDCWSRSWKTQDELPSLAVCELNDDWCLLLDTRKLPGTRELNLISPAQARVALTGTTESGGDLQWALEKKVVVQHESVTVPLATAEPQLFQAVLDEARPRGRGAEQRVRSSPYGDESEITRLVRRLIN